MLPGEKQDIWYFDKEESKNTRENLNFQQMRAYGRGQEQRFQPRMSGWKEANS